MLILKLWREILILCLLTACGVIYKLYPRIETVQSPPITVERIITRTITKTITKLPDGTEIAVEKEESGSQEIPKVTPIVKIQPFKYSAGVLMRNLDYKDLFFDVSARLGSLPVSAVLGYEVKGSNFLLGLRYEF